MTRKQLVDTCLSQPEAIEDFRSVTMFRCLRSAERCSLYFPFGLIVSH